MNDQEHELWVLRYLSEVIKLVRERKRDQEAYAEKSDIGKTEHTYTAGVLRNLEKELVKLLALHEARSRLGDWLANSFEPGNCKWVVQDVHEKYGEIDRRIRSMEQELIDLDCSTGENALNIDNLLVRVKKLEEKR